MNTTLVASIAAIVLGSIAGCCTLLGGKGPRSRFVLVGGVLSLVVAAVQVFGAIAVSIEGNRFQSRVIDLQERAIQQGDKVRELQADLAARADKIATLSERLAARTQELAGYVTGGNSTPVLEVRPDGHRVHFIVHAHGKFPIYNVRLDLARILPAAMFGQTLFGRGLFGGPAEIPIPLATPAPNELSAAQAIVLGSEEPPREEGTIEYRAWLHARNGWWQQVVKLQASASGWRVLETTVINSSRAVGVE